MNTVSVKREEYGKERKESDWEERRQVQKCGREQLVTKIIVISKNCFPFNLLFLCAYLHQVMMDLMCLWWFFQLEHSFQTQVPELMVFHWNQTLHEILLQPFSKALFRCWWQPVLNPAATAQIHKWPAKKAENYSAFSLVLYIFHQKLNTTIKMLFNFMVPNTLPIILGLQGMLTIYILVSLNIFI